MATKKYITLNNLSTFLTILRETFAEIGHKHSISDVTDYVIDTELSPTSVNPVQNKIIDAEFEAVSTAMNAMEMVIDEFTITDTTLSEVGKAADAKAVGDAIAQFKIIDTTEINALFEN